MLRVSTGNVNILAGPVETPDAHDESDSLRAQSRMLMEHFAAYFGGELHCEPTTPVIVFPHGIASTTFRGLQRALIGRYRVAWDRL